MEIKQFIALAEQAGVKLELSGGLPTWEAFPGSRHQKAVRRIERSIIPSANETECGCFDLADTYIRFPDGSLKRPDLAIFSSEPPDTDEALSMIPAAVIEVISKESAAKDLKINPPLYLSNGVLDVVIVDPRMNLVWHHRQSGMTEHRSPIQLELECGCLVTV